MEECNFFFVPDNHEGCSLAGPPNSGGPSLNADGGGVFATKWTHEGIKMRPGFNMSIC